MSLIHTPSSHSRLRFHPQAYLFVTEALKVAQDGLGRASSPPTNEESAHISGRELLDGIRILGCKTFGMMAPTVFRNWGVETTLDFGRVVFDLVDRGELRKTDNDCLADFADVYDFAVVFHDHYYVDISKAFRG